MPRGLLAALCFVASCASSIPMLAAPTVQKFERLAANDVLDVRVFQEPELTGAYRVSPSGDIDFPFCGRIVVAGLSLAEAKSAITGCLEKHFVKRPQVSLTAKEFNALKVFVFGEVAKPGILDFEQGMTIIHAISEAGGFTKAASKNRVQMARVVQGKENHMTIPVGDIVRGNAKNVLIEPGDIIVVPESYF